EVQLERLEVHAVNRGGFLRDSLNGVLVLLCELLEQALGGRIHGLGLRWGFVLGAHREGGLSEGANRTAVDTDEQASGGGPHIAVCWGTWRGAVREADGRDGSRRGGEDVVAGPRSRPTSGPDDAQDRARTARVVSSPQL